MPGTRVKTFQDRACTACSFYAAEWDGEVGSIYCGSSCEKPGNERFGNLKTFPFKNKRSCFIVNFWFSEFVDKIKTGSEEELDRLWKAYQEKYHENIQS